MTTAPEDSQETPANIPHTVTARIACTNPQFLQTARVELAKLAAATLQEPGCTQFAIFEEHNSPGSFIMWESFVDHAAFEQHFTYPHTVNYVAQQLTTVVEYWAASPLLSE